ncbi:DUF1289 domain-containing protein [Bosea sp. OK403]|uniref:DUF1289 domain-containing protein n=1 Tax=Bosea sp. OK403 TaxID=1855286 RepID=UPI000B8305BB|nr:DUF1289 domain-containing protein [Bosea sp. OK403]
MTAASSPSLSSPCVKVCVIDPASKLCQGCCRTLREIAQWTGMSEAQRLAVMALLPERMRAQVDRN